MKRKLRVVSRFALIGLIAGSLGFATGIVAQTDSAKKIDTAKSSVSEKDQKFIKKAVKGGAMEVELGTLASQNATSDDVKAFGKRMVADHSKATDELKSIAEKKGAKVPAKKPSVKWNSDKEYMDMMVKDHEKNLAEFQVQARDGDDAELKEFAEKTAKVIEQHLTLAKETRDKLK